MIKDLCQAPVFFYDRAPEGVVPPSREVAPESAVPKAPAEVAPLVQAPEAKQMADVIAHGLATEKGDLTNTISQVAHRTHELSTDAPQKTAPAESPVRSLADIVAAPDMEGMRLLEGRIITTPDGPMVIGKPQINIGSGEVGVLAHPLGKPADAATTRLSLSALASPEVGEMTDEEYIASDIEEADISEAAQAIAEDPEAQAVVDADMAQLMNVLADKKGSRLDLVIERAQSFQAAETPTVKVYGIDLEAATLQLKRDQLIRKTQKHPQKAAELQPAMDSINARLKELTTSREEFAQEQNQLTELGMRLGVLSDAAQAEPLVALRDAVQTTHGRTQLLEKFAQLSQDESQFQAMHESVKAIAKREKNKSRAHMAGLSMGIVMAIMAGMVAMMASGRR